MAVRLQGSLSWFKTVMEYIIKVYLGICSLVVSPAFTIRFSAVFHGAVTGVIGGDRVCFYSVSRPNALLTILTVSSPMM